MEVAVTESAMSAVSSSKSQAATKRSALLNRPLLILGAALSGSGRPGEFDERRPLTPREASGPKAGVG